MFRVLSCVIYTIIGKYICIHYLGSDKSKLSYLHIGIIGKYKHYYTYYDNVLGIGIPNLFLIFCLVAAFQRITNLLS